MACKAGMHERHWMLCSPPSNEEFKDKQLFDVLIEFIAMYLPKMYGSNKVRSMMVANPGSNLTHLITASDLAYGVTLIHDKKEVWEQQVRLTKLSPEERKQVQEDVEYAVVEPKFTSRRNGPNYYMGNAWSKEGIEFYNDKLSKWRKKFRGEIFWDMLQTSWEMYETDNDLVKMWRKVVSCRSIVFYLHCF